tara:strand:- start:10132 stop:12243 length:2112 start_codon:yes stop_codon:yes gene_type:complete
MAIANYFYNQTTRKYVALFGTMFNQLKIKREDNAGVTQKEMIVPLSYAPFQKILARVAADPDLINSRRPAMTLPRMSFEMTSLNYDPSRKVGATQKLMKRNKAETDDGRDFIYSPVPYNLDFSLYIMTKYAEDATKLMEQILPFFTPDFTVSAQMIAGLDPVDIPIIMTSVTTEDLYEGAFEERQAILYTLTFTLKGWYFGPEKRKQVIKFVDIDMFNGTQNDAPFIEGIDIRPGLSANGTPITVDGLQATARANLINGTVGSITVTNSGEEYNANTIVTVAAPDVANAVLTATLSGGSIPSIAVTDGGGYFTTTPTISISLPDATPVTATATASTANGSIDSITVTNGGNFYSNPTFTISAPPSNSPQFKFGDDALNHGDYDDVTLLHTSAATFNSATGYKIQLWIYPTEFPGGNPFSLLFAPFIKLLYNSDDGQVKYQYGGGASVNSDSNITLNMWNHIEVEHSGAQIRINVNGVRGTTTTKGSGNVLFPGHLIRAGDAQGNESVFDGANRSFKGYVDNVTWTVQETFNSAEDGNVYSVPTTAQQGSLFERNFDKTLPAADIVITDGQVSAISVSAGGEAYGNTTPIVTIDAPDGIAADFAATASLNLVAGIIDSVTMTNNGKFYANTPTVNVSAPTATTATATPNILVNGDISSITVTNAGLGYRTVPDVFITSPDFGSVPYGDIEFDDNWGVIKTIVSE